MTDLLNLQFDRALGERLLWAAITIAVAYGLGHLINVIVVSRLQRIAKGTKGAWDDILTDELRRRIPFWSLLVGMALALVRFDLDPNSFAFASTLIRVLGIASVTLAVSGVASRLIALQGGGPAARPVSRLSQNLARFVIIVLGVLVIASGLGYDIRAYLTALGVGGLAVALALQDPLSNLFGGIFMSISGQVRIGDYVRLDSGFEGYIADFDWRSTRIRTQANNIIVVPNAKLASSVVTNFSQPSTEITVGVELAVDYRSDLETVERVTNEVAREVMRDVTGAADGFEPAVRFHTIAASNINFNVGLRGREYTDQSLLKHELIKRLKVRYEQEKIGWPVPVTMTVTHDASQGEIPPAETSV
jgi:small-conductance mechanosensitive channel